MEMNLMGRHILKYIAPGVTKLDYFFFPHCKTDSQHWKPNPFRWSPNPGKSAGHLQTWLRRERTYTACKNIAVYPFPMICSDKEGSFPQDRLWGGVCPSPGSRARVSSFFISSSHFSFLVLLGRQLRQRLALPRDKPPCSCQKQCWKNGSAVF